jgi:hypothetical protein
MNEIDKSVKVGLQLWLVFVVSLFLLGYPVIFSIVLAAIAGAAGGFIVSWQNSKADTPPKQIKAITQLRKQLGLTGEGRDNQSRHSSRRRDSKLSGLRGVSKRNRK